MQFAWNQYEIMASLLYCNDKQRTIDHVNLSVDFVNEFHLSSDLYTEENFFKLWESIRKIFQTHTILLIRHYLSILTNN